MMKSKTLGVLEERRGDVVLSKKMVCMPMLNIGSFQVLTQLYLTFTPPLLDHNNNLPKNQEGNLVTVHRLISLNQIIAYHSIFLNQVIKIFNPL